MGQFRVDIEIENPASPGARRVVRSALSVFNDMEDVERLLAALPKV